MDNLLVKTSGQDPIADDSIKTLLLLHGWGMNSQVWEPVREALESKYHLLWVDLPGHGFNRHLAAKNLSHIVDLIAAVIPDNTHLLGWSLGGLVAQAVADKVPQKISSMTMVTSTPRFSQSEDKGWQHAMSEEVLNRFADNLKQDTEKTLKGFIALQFIGVKNAKQAQNKLIEHILNSEKMPKKWGGVFDKLNRTVLLDTNQDQNNELVNNPSDIPTQEALDTGLAILKHADLRKLSPSNPQHWIFAEYDRLIPKEVIKDLISLRPDAEITLLEKAGHAPFITHPEAFLNCVNYFIDSIE